MASVNRESYAAAAEKLTAATQQATAAQLATTADEFLSVARLLRGEPRLRRALTDPSRSGGDRAELVRSILAGKLGDTTVDTLATLVSGRFSRPSELLDASERLGVDTVLSSADKAGTLAEVEDELFRFGQIVSGNAELAVTLSDPSAPAEQRVKLAQDLLKGKAQAATIQLIAVALEGFGGRSFESSLSRLVELTAAKRDREVAYVTVAKLLGEAEEQALAAKLSDIYGRQVSLKVDVDPSIVGGVSVRVGSDLYDGTILRRLNEARQAFAK
ncbi:putative F-type proton-transporting ATPase delta chain [Actinoplanes friuliensis DSM 7358]|jgi:F-type H+-transporting ATPase subunit delta|uniref:ATP synthase subunit delta n=2 Tax=Actinoplanes friuliensis TaxID=196914 RepID=U5W9A6_9ACTN|nr:putative F-type proton-transporting ATPase delta chain [Actinoplanes friuliensis DSM 7358]